MHINYSLFIVILPIIYCIIAVTKLWHYKNITGTRRNKVSILGLVFTLWVFYLLQALFSCCFVIYPLISNSECGGMKKHLYKMKEIKI